MCIVCVRGRWGRMRVCLCERELWEGLVYPVITEEEIQLSVTHTKNVKQLSDGEKLSHYQMRMPLS